MMSSATAMGIGKATGAGAPAAGEGPQPDGDGFLVALTAAAAGPSRQAAEPEEAPGRDPAAGDPTLAGLAALLSGLLPVTPVVRPVGSAADPAVADATVPAAAGANLLANGGSGRALQPALAQQPLQETAEELIEGQVANAMDDQVGQASTARDVLRQLSLALTGAPRESPADIRPAIAPELPAASSSSHGISQLAPGSAAAASPAGAEQTLRSPVGSPRWAEELGSRLVLLSARGQHEGSLTLTPEHLGPLEVRITVSQNTANVWFGAQQADTRAALAEALPRLREMFAEAGLALGESGVSREAPRQGSAEAAPWSVSRAMGAEDLSPAVEVRQVASALLDLYA